MSTEVTCIIAPNIFITTTPQNSGGGQRSLNCPFSPIIFLPCKTQQKNFEGRLTELNKNSIVLNWKQREPKKIGKGKVTVNKSVDISFMDITEAKVKVKI